MKENVYEIVNSLGFQKKHEFVEYLANKKVKILDNPNGHDYGPSGSTFVIRDKFSCHIKTNDSGKLIMVSINNAKTGQSFNNHIRLNSLEFNNEDRESLIQEIKTLEAQKTSVDDKLDLSRKKLGYLQETKQKVFDDSQFEIFTNLTPAQKRAFIKKLNK